MFPYQARQLPGYGRDFKAQVRHWQPGFLFLGTFCKATASAENMVTVDPHRVDAYGIPIPVIHYRFSENDRTMWREHVKSLLELCARLKGKVFAEFGQEPSGFASHEVGTVRMGKDRRTSCLNSFCQSHEVKNLFVTDGSSFTTSSEKNPTLTIMALSARAADYIKRQRRLGEL
jgi:choline dehydrogenase-like flavoprotein